MKYKYCLLVLALISAGSLLFNGCGKKNEDKKPDYTCNCSGYGTNLVTWLIHKPLTLLPVYNGNGKYGYILPDGTLIFPYKYTLAYRFSNDLALIGDATYGKEYAGFINTDNAMAIEPKFRWIANEYFSKEGLFPVGDVHTYKIGFINRDGNLAIPCKYYGVDAFHEGMALVTNGLYMGAIDVNGNETIPLMYNVMTDFSEGLAFAETKTGQHGYIDKSNKFVTEGDYTEGGLFVNGLAWVNDPISHLYGFIRKDGSYQVQPRYESVGCFWEGYAAVEQDGKWGFIDQAGKLVIPCQFSDVAVGFCEGLAPVRHGKWGYIGTDGTFKIDPQFDKVDIFCCSRAAVSWDDGSYGYIDKQGKTIWRCDHSSLKSAGNPLPFFSDMDYMPGKMKSRNGTLFGLSNR